MKFTKNSFLKYSPEITEEIYNAFIEELSRQRFKFFYHCGDLSYSNWKRLGYINIDINGIRYGKIKGDGFTIDNNTQGITNKIFLEDIIHLKNISYEMY